MQFAGLQRQCSPILATHHQNAHTRQDQKRTTQDASAAVELQDAQSPSGDVDEGQLLIEPVRSVREKIVNRHEQSSLFGCYILVGRTLDEEVAVKRSLFTYVLLEGCEPVHKN